jgi:vacuolar protein sorting-associated protein 33A
VEHEFSIFFAPRRTLVSNAVLEEAGIIGDVNIAELPLYFLPLEQDVLSLELEDAFSDLYLVWHVLSQVIIELLLTMTLA